MAKEEKRFVKVYSDGAFGSNEIWVDTKTGVNYLFHAAGYAGGLTVLLNRDGTPVVSPLPLKEEK
ncbi:MAG: xylan 1,4-beta-xylosidase [Ruminococcaceae bacterium]|nr:xylan 1,4-beta-xylosidase [Oscillospiraceae bacterium]